jgi:hypothetical protein
MFCFSCVTTKYVPIPSKDKDSIPITKVTLTVSGGQVTPSEFVGQGGIAYILKENEFFTASFSAENPGGVKKIKIRVIDRMSNTIYSREVLSSPDADGKVPTSMSLLRKEDGSPIRYKASEVYILEVMASNYNDMWSPPYAVTFAIINPRISSDKNEVFANDKLKISWEAFNCGEVSIEAYRLGDDGKTYNKFTDNNIPKISPNSFPQSGMIDADYQPIPRAIDTVKYVLKTGHWLGYNVSETKIAVKNPVTFLKGAFQFGVLQGAPVSIKVKIEGKLINACFPNIMRGRAEFSETRDHIIRAAPNTIETVDFTIDNLKTGRWSIIISVENAPQLALACPNQIQVPGAYYFNRVTSNCSVIGIPLVGFCK